MSKAEFTTIEKHRDYSIVWQIFNKNSEIGKRFNVQGDISLPHFLDKQDSERLSNNEEIGMNEYNLTIGLLLEYFTPPPLTATHNIKPYFKDVLLWLLKECVTEYGIQSTEEYILLIANKLCAEYSVLLSYKTLKAGLEIIPSNPKILKQMWILAEALQKNE